MTEQQMPERIWATEFENRVELWTIKPKAYQHVFIRADLAERMAEALERCAEARMPGEARRIAREALSEFKAASHV